MSNLFKCGAFCPKNIVKLSMASGLNSLSNQKCGSVGETGNGDLNAVLPEGTAEAVGAEDTTDKPKDETDIVRG